MKKKFMRGIAAFLATVMMLPTAAFANTGEGVLDSAPDQETLVVQSETESALAITCADALEVWDGNGKSIKLTVTDGYSVTWESEDSSIASVSSNGTVTGVSGTEAGTSVKIYAYAKGEMAECTVTVYKRSVQSIAISGDPKTSYVEGEKFSIGSASVVATYNDGLSEPVSGYDVSPSGKLRPEDTSVEIEYEGKTANVTVTVAADAVSSIDIVSPKSGKEYKVGDTIARSDVSIEVQYTVGKPVTLKAEDYSEIKITPSGALKKTDTELTVEYGGKTDKILIAVKDATVSSAITNMKDSSGYITPTSMPSKMAYTTGEKFDPAGMTLYLTYSDSTKNYLYDCSKLTVSSAFTSASTNKAITWNLTDAYGNSFKFKVSGITITSAATVNVTGLNNSTTGSNKYVIDSDAEISIGDDLDWEDVFDYVYIKYTSSGSTKYKKISDDEDLENFLGSTAKLHLVVYDKDSDEDTVEDDDIDDGQVKLMLYLEYAGTKYTSTSSKYITFKMDVSDVACTVSVYRSSSSSTVLGSKVFDDITDALDALEDEDDVIDEFDVSNSYKNSFVIKIKLGEDQSYTSTFAPDHEHAITIDLNGYELKLKSEWIDYDDCEDLTVTVTNTNEDDYGTLTYRDLSTSLVVVEDSELEFSEGEIPMDSDAACMVSVYRSSTSSTVEHTKVYDDLADALDALEDFEDEFDDELSSSNVIKIKLGEDQTLTSSYKFAPDFENTITIDLNGNTLKLKSEWIDYDDCEDLIVYVTNTNDDDDATLTYSDLSASLTISDGDSLKFEEDVIPGIYKISLGTMTNGKATMSKDTIAHGGTVKFTITPNSGYAIDTVKVNSKTVKTSDYSVDSKGVGTLELKEITEDKKLDVTFKKASTTTTTEKEDTSTTTDWINPFTDVSKNAQYYDAVAFVCSEGLFNGMTATKFEPTTTMTRAMFVTVLGRLADIDVSRYSGTSFTDVSKTDQQISWATPYIEWAVQNGITQGTGNGKFSPNDPITHQQMYLFMYRYAMFIENLNTNIANVSLSSIRDASEIADWAQDGVKFASKNNILITSGGKLTPADNALRCELAMLLEGFCTKVLGYND